MNKTEYKNKVSRNKTIIDLTFQYVDERNLSGKELKQINMVQLWKEMYLPIELLGYRERQLIHAFEEIYKKSIIK